MRVAVIGLGRFGASLAVELVEQGVEVLGLDGDPALVQKYADEVSDSAVVDSTDPQALKQLGVETFDHVVVGIGSDLEGSVLTVSALLDIGVADIWAKAISRQHARILERIGAHHVVLPEHEMGARVAHLVIDRRMLDYVEFDDDFAMAKAPAPRDLVGFDLKSSKIRTNYDVTIVAVKRRGAEFTFAGLDTVVHEGDVLIVAGHRRALARFAESE
ncbi:potassium channel family protein [Gordonia neofelifaecis]|uniref:Potassium uptake protein n=1 Tax=Gordonia neofelifaecis NRRL B-59395 TaxID=644548 RepID=F1YNR2_9ACTN|nr:TrkA family potassium uptake protein [Gordonia neofelifaecis]EGD53669.1 potassium uptake protein [Gordonia neofelifaecis NRRL B-59395]